MRFAGAWLARRLEAAEAANDVACVASQPGVVAERFGGGWAIFAGAGSPLSRAIGLGLEGAVAESALDELERFFESRGAGVAIDLCPLADPGLLEALSRRGYRAVEFSNALVRPLEGVERYPDESAVRRAEDEASWSRVVGAGFFEHAVLTHEEMDVGTAIWRSGGADCYLALSATGEAAAGAALSFHDGLALLFADATLPRFRRQGLHGALIRRRLNDALARGCDMAAATTAPGGASQRSYERHGFQVAYTKVVLEKPKK